jgi:hypothetical protein
MLLKAILTGQVAVPGYLDLGHYRQIFFPIGTIGLSLEIIFHDEGYKAVDELNPFSSCGKTTPSRLAGLKNGAPPSSPPIEPVAPVVPVVPIPPVAPVPPVGECYPTILFLADFFQNFTEDLVLDICTLKIFRHGSSSLGRSPQTGIFVGYQSIP